MPIKPCPFCGAIPKKAGKSKEGIPIYSVNHHKMARMEFTEDEQFRAVTMDECPFVMNPSRLPDGTHILYPDELYAWELRA